MSTPLVSDQKTLTELQQLQTLVERLHQESTRRLQEAESLHTQTLQLTTLLEPLGGISGLQKLGSDLPLLEQRFEQVQAVLAEFSQREEKFSQREKDWQTQSLQHLDQVQAIATEVRHDVSELDRMGRAIEEQLQNLGIPESLSTLQQVTEQAKALVHELQTHIEAAQALPATLLPSLEEGSRVLQALDERQTILQEWLPSLDSALASVPTALDSLSSHTQSSQEQLNTLTATLQNQLTSAQQTQLDHWIQTYTQQHLAQHLDHLIAERLDPTLGQVKATLETELSHKLDSVTLTDQGWQQSIGEALTRIESQMAQLFETATDAQAQTSELSQETESIKRFLSRLVRRLRRVLPHLSS